MFVTFVGAPQHRGSDNRWFRTIIKRVDRLFDHCRSWLYVVALASVLFRAMFHCCTHAFFKAMLFLGAGSGSTRSHHEQGTCDKLWRTDVRKFLIPSWADDDCVRWRSRFRLFR